MSLEALHAEVQSYRTEAGRLAEDFSQIRDKVANDPNLTITGKREHLEPMHRDVTDQIAALRAREKAAVKSQKEKLERRAFGLSPSASSNPAQVVSFRDAQTRARQLEYPDDAEELYESAKRSGDTILAAAVLEKALVHGWNKIKDDYLESHATTRADLDDLTALAKYTDNGIMNLTHYMTPPLNLPHPAGFPDIPPLHSRHEPQHSSLPNWMR